MIYGIILFHFFIYQNAQSFISTLPLILFPILTVRFSNIFALLPVVQRGELIVEWFGHPVKVDYGVAFCCFGM